jgi:ubiquinone/menaquinone biosynthesis C-methylase UbiE
MKSQSRSHQTKVSEQFGSTPEAYLSSAVHSQGADLQAVVGRLTRKPCGSVLDMGCGAGHLSFAIAPDAEHVVAYDLSPEMLQIVSREAGRRGFTNLSTQQGKAEVLPFSNGTFDWVCTRYSAHHWTDIRVALREAWRVLKPGGSIIVIDVCAPSDALLDSHLQAVELLRDGSHVRDYRNYEWLQMLTGAGFTPRSSFEWKLPLAFSPWIERMKTPPVFVHAIRELLSNAPHEVRSYFQVSIDSSFVPDAALFEASRNE